MKFAPTKFPGFKQKVLAMLDEMQEVHVRTPFDKQSDEFYKIFQKYGCL